MIEVKNLTRWRGKGLPPVLSDVSFKVRNRKIYGLLGYHHTGKSTLLGIMAGALESDEGTVLINGYDIRKQPLEAKRQIGYLPQTPPLLPEMTPYEYLSFVAEVKGVKGELRHAQVEEALALTGLTSVQDRLIGHLSKGHKQRVGLAQALLGNPDIIMLDEPTAGMDGHHTTETRELIRRLGQTKTVIVSSHILTELTDLCDHIILLSEGQVIADDTPEALMALVPSLEDLFATLTRQAAEVPTVEFEDTEDAETSEDILTDEPQGHLPYTDSQEDA